ncbi:MAG TPA: hypothetical protein VEG33_14555, partial [Streptosporangiaceae bacterium]|nr:hypothetical protein [Streptosporangiaceae bacterium]
KGFQICKTELVFNSTTCIGVRYYGQKPITALPSSPGFIAVRLLPEIHRNPNHSDEPGDRL